VKLLVVGDGAQEVWLRQLARDSGIEPSVIWVGARHDVGNYLQVMMCSFCPRSTRVLASQPSRRYGPGYQLLPAPSLCKGVRNPGMGRLVPPRAPDHLASALLELLQDEPLRRRLSEAGKAMAREQFQPDRYARRLEQVWLRLLARKGIR